MKQNKPYKGVLCILKDLYRKAAKKLNPLNIVIIYVIIGAALCHVISVIHI
jgi:hypothetical protein